MKRGTERNVSCSLGLVYKTKVPIRDGGGGGLCMCFSRSVTFVLLLQKKMAVSYHVIVRPVRGGTGEAF